VLLLRLVLRGWRNDCMWLHVRGWLAGKGSMAWLERTCTCRLLK
jgi:hypothetical protein